MIRTRTLYAPFKVNAKAAIGWEKAPLNKVELEGIMIMMVDGADGFRHLVVVFKQKRNPILVSCRGPHLVLRISFILIITMMVRVVLMLLLGSYG